MVVRLLAAAALLMLSAFMADARAASGIDAGRITVPGR